MSSILLLINAIKIPQSEGYINPEKFNGKVFKAYYGLMVEVLYDLDYIYYWYCADYIITENS